MPKKHAHAKKHAHKSQAVSDGSNVGEEPSESIHELVNDNEDCIDDHGNSTAGSDGCPPHEKDMRHHLSNGRFGGWVPDLPDHRDTLLMDNKVRLFGTPALPSKFSLRTLMTSVYDQGQLGSCTGNGVAALLEYLWTVVLGNAKPFSFSRLWLYLQARIVEGSLHEDAGARIRDVIKQVAALGCCSEYGNNSMSYDIDAFDVIPPQAVSDIAALHQLISYYRVNNTNLQEIKAALFGNISPGKSVGHPVVFGQTVYAGIQSPRYDAKSNHHIIPSPGRFERPEGGHCMVITGWDDAAKLFEIRNSWGTDWGDEGYAWMHYADITNPNRTDDCWIATAEETGLMN